jgi:hypothetical protein
VRFLLNQGNNHAVQVEEEHDQVEAQLDKGFLDAASASVVRSNGTNAPMRTHCSGQSYSLVDVQLSEDFSCIKQVLIVNDSAILSDSKFQC